MSVTWKVSGAPLTIPLDISDLSAPEAVTTITAAMATAQPGTVIDMSAEPCPNPLPLVVANVVKRDPGIFVRWHPDQVYYVSHGSAQNAGITYMGGRASFDLVTFDPLNGNNYGILIGENTSRIRVAGVLFDQSRDAINIRRGTDVEIDACTFQFALNDCIKGSSPNRVRINNTINTIITQSWTIGYYDNGDPPEYGVGRNAATSKGGKWIDTSHSDFVQFFEDTATSPLYGAQDVIIENSEYDIDGQGIVNAGSSADGDGDEIWRRVLIRNMTCRATLPYNIFITGTDIEVRDTLIGSSLDKPLIFGATNMVAGIMTPQPDWIDGWRHRGGNLTTEGDGNIFAANAFVSDGQPGSGEQFFQGNVNYASTTINGATVTAPEPPRIAPVPAWVPAYTRPTNTFPAAVPLNIILPEIVWFGGPYDGNTEPNPAEGRWLSARRGFWRAGTRFGNTEYQWLRNGVAIPGATNGNYQVTAADSGQQIAVQVRHENATGWSLYATSTAIVPV